MKMRDFKRLVGEYFSLSFGTLPGRAASGAAVVVSSKAASHAVDRNKIKRRCRVVFSEYVKTHSVATTIILYAKKDAAKASFAEIKKDIENLLSKI